MKVRSGFVSNSSSSSFVLYGYKMNIDDVAEHVGVFRAADTPLWEYQGDVREALSGMGIGSLMSYDTVFFGKIIGEESDWGDVPLSAFEPVALQKELDSMMAKFGATDGAPRIWYGEVSTE